MKTIPLLSCLALICATGCKPCEYKAQIEREAYQKGYEDAYIFVLKQVNTCNSYIGTLKIGEGPTFITPTNCLFLALDYNVEVNNVTNSHCVIMDCTFASGFTFKKYWNPVNEPVAKYLENSKIK